MSKVLLTVVALFMVTALNAVNAVVHLHSPEPSPAISVPTVSSRIALNLRVPVIFGREQQTEQLKGLRLQGEEDEEWLLEELETVRLNELIHQLRLLRRAIYAQQDEIPYQSVIGPVRGMISPERVAVNFATSSNSDTREDDESNELIEGEQDDDSTEKNGAIDSADGIHSVPPNHLYVSTQGRQWNVENRGKEHIALGRAGKGYLTPLGGNVRFVPPGYRYVSTNGPKWNVENHGNERHDLGREGKGHLESLKLRFVPPGYRYVSTNGPRWNVDNRGTESHDLGREGNGRLERLPKEEPLPKEERLPKD